MESYKSYFLEEDERVDISLCDHAAGIVKELLVHSVEGNFDRETTREKLWELSNIIRELKSREESEQSHVEI